MVRSYLLSPHCKIGNVGSSCSLVQMQISMESFVHMKNIYLVNYSYIYIYILWPINISKYFSYSSYVKYKKHLSFSFCLSLYIYIYINNHKVHHLRKFKN